MFGRKNNDDKDKDNKKGKEGDKKNAKTGTKKATRKKQMKPQKPTFPIDEIYTLLKKGRGKVSPQVPLYLGGVYEYITAEILEKAGNHAVSRRSTTIDARDIVAAIQTDPELDKVVGPCISKLGEAE